MKTLREQAISFGIENARRQFDGRTGHGESSRVVYRQMDETTMAATLGAAFEAGAEAMMKARAEEVSKLKAEKRALADGLRRIAKDTKGFDSLSSRGVYHQIATEALAAGGEVV